MVTNAALKKAIRSLAKSENLSYTDARTRLIDNEKSTQNQPFSVAVIGIGGRGTNYLSSQSSIANDMRGTTRIAIDSDDSQIQNVHAALTLHVGSDSAFTTTQEHELQTALSGVGLAFIIAGAGGNAGMNYAEIVGTMTQESHIATVAIVGMPFAFEGEQRQAKANAQIASLSKVTDLLIVVPNEPAASGIPGDTSVFSFFTQKDDHIALILQHVLTTVPNGRRIGSKILDNLKSVGLSEYPEAGTMGGKILQVTPEAVAALISVHEVEK